MFEARELKEENDIIRAKALPGTKKKEPANLPHEFVTNDDFCPGCGLELKSQAPERGYLWQDVFQVRHLRRCSAPRRAHGRSSPGCSPSAAGRSNAGWAAIAASTSRICAPTSTSMKKALPEKYAYVHGVADAREAGRTRSSHLRGNPMREGDVVPRRFLSVLSADDAGAADPRQRPPRPRRSRSSSSRSPRA